MKNEIKELVQFAINDKTTTNKKVELNVIDAVKAKFLKLKTGFDLLGYKRVIDKSGIKHTLNQHGNLKTEQSRGQLQIVNSDF